MNPELIEIKTKEAYRLLDDLIDLCKNAAVERPHIVVIILHEYFRNIWPNDPFILNVLSEDRLENIILCLKKSITVLENTKFLGSYFSAKNDLINKFDNVNVDENHLTQTVYGNLWKDLNDDYINNESKKHHK